MAAFDDTIVETTVPAGNSDAAVTGLVLSDMPAAAARSRSLDALFMIENQLEGQFLRKLARL